MRDLTIYQVRKTMRVDFETQSLSCVDKILFSSFIGGVNQDEEVCELRL